jgi:hypothetical protein
MCVVYHTYLALSPSHAPSDPPPPVRCVSPSLVTTPAPFPLLPELEAEIFLSLISLLINSSIFLDSGLKRLHILQAICFRHSSSRRRQTPLPASQLDKHGSFTPQ